MHGKYSELMLPPLGTLFAMNAGGFHVKSPDYTYDCIVRLQMLVGLLLSCTEMTHCTNSITKLSHLHFSPFNFCTDLQTLTKKEANTAPPGELFAVPQLSSHQNAMWAILVPF